MAKFIVVGSEKVESVGPFGPVTAWTCTVRVEPSEAMEAECVGTAREAGALEAVQAHLAQTVTGEVTGVTDNASLPAGVSLVHVRATARKSRFAKK